MAKQTKRTKKFLKSNLDRTLKTRREHQKKKAVIERSKQAKKAKSLRSTHSRGKGKKEGDEDDERLDDDIQEQGLLEGDDGSDDELPGSNAATQFKDMSVDDFLGGGFKKGMGGDEDDEDEDEDEEDDDESLGEIEEMSDEEDDHAQDLAKLAEKDPEFYKYLQENDEGLLNFGAGSGGDDDDDDEEGEEQDDEDDEEEENQGQISKGKGKGKGKQEDEGAEMEVDEDDGGPIKVSQKMLLGWQRSMLQHGSIKSLRKLLLAFRCAVRMGDDEASEGAAFMIEDAKVFNKIVLTTLKYTPVVLQAQLPFKELPNGKFKLPTNNKKWSTLQKPVQSYFTSLIHLLKTLPEPKMLYVVVTESARMVPYAINNKRAARDYVKVMLNLWSTADDDVRIAAFLALRKIAPAGDDAMLELCLKGAYHSFVRSTKLTTVHTLPSINLMKNSASELYALDAAASYQQAFGFIRQLAIHLRNCIKTKSKDSFKAIFNWQYVHCVDFWSLILSKACDADAVAERGVSEMQPLIYPLVQVATGVINLIPTSRYFPFRLHILRALLRLVQKTGTYVPLIPPILGIFESPEFHRKPKGSTLKPLDLDTSIRAPTSYIRTKVYSDQLAEEACQLLLEFLSSQSRSIAFPELVIPATVQLKRGMKAYTNPKLNSSLKQILEKVNQNSAWVEKRRSEIDFAPNDRRKVNNFLQDEKSETPLEAALRLARKVREQKRKIVEQANQKVEEEDSD
ncbi:Noc2-domain-containing protein [Violaceomyces palustris]|uniref:Noc2-domain-containing protein n=1 Tax=Violaceomyces palustris TaxID=1673888 RepID=A0ACD0NW67_9BASI|nr:Noc2-domain-containing protein [Violaceomyces palustris]